MHAAYPPPTAWYLSRPSRRHDPRGRGRTRAVDSAVTRGPSTCTVVQSRRGAHRPPRGADLVDHARGGQPRWGAEGLHDLEPFLLETQQLDPWVIAGEAARCSGHRSAVELETIGAQLCHDLRQPQPAVRRIDGESVATGHCRVGCPEAASDDEAVGTDRDIEPECRVAPGDRALVVLVGALVRTEPHVTIRPEQMGRAELVLEGIEQRLHGSPHGLRIRLLVGHPVGACVVRLQALVEGDGCGREASERRVCASFPEYLASMAHDPPEAELRRARARPAPPIGRRTT